MAQAVGKIDALLNFLGDEKSQESAQDVVYQVEYFPLGGRAAPIRLAFYLQDIEYEDVFINFPAFKEMQKDYKDLAWWGVPQMRILDAKSRKQVDLIGQTNSLLRYIARLGSVNNVKGAGQDTFSLYPITDAKLCLKIDEICDAVEDLSNSFGSTMRLATDKEKETKRKELWKTRWSVLFSKFNDKLKGGGSTFIVGNDLTIADLKMYFLLSHFTSGVIDHIDKDFINEDRYKNLKTYFENMKSIGKIGQFITGFDQRAKEWKAAQEKK